MNSILVVWIFFFAWSELTDDIDARTITGTKNVPVESFSVWGRVSCKCRGADAEFRFPVEELEMVLKSQEKIASIEGCTNCSADVINCRFSYGKNRYSCEQKRVAKLVGKDFLISRDIPSYEHISITRDSSVAVNRTRRDIEGLGACNFPRNLKTSHLSCTEYPNKIKCTQRCIFGHTLDEGISREMKCEFNQNVWKPAGFQECNPFVDCSMTLVATGNKSCLVGTPYVPSVCNVTCGDYEDKVATPLTSFECQLNGGWDKPLPHCVISGSGFALVPPPRVKAHTPFEKEDHTKISKKGDKHLKMEKPQKMDKPKNVQKPQMTDKSPKHVKPQKPSTVAPKN